ncbi:MAG: hypothetical protein IIB61_09735 [Planctomycetes bacterium]|nr:hypothetical protein [Planctomycetota bacterium]MCH8252693.1 hypothetical protein [Planctomycetota bacterium]
MRTHKRFTLFAVAVVLTATAQAALAGVLPSPFGFSFFTPELTSIFLFPFALIGCG